jgi:hypothetical protein
MLFMTPEEWAAEAASAKHEYESETKELDLQLERTRAKLARLEKRRAAIDALFRTRMAQLGASLLGLTGPEMPSTLSTPAVSRKALTERKRGALDEPVLVLAREIASPDVTSKQIEEVWNQRNPDRSVSDSTVRSVLKRLVDNELMRISEPGGGKGSGIPTKYRPV